MYISSCAGMLMVVKFVARSNDVRVTNMKTIYRKPITLLGISQSCPSWACWISWVFSVIFRSRRDSVGGGGSSRIFPWSPQMFTPYSWVQAHILLKYYQNSHFFHENYLAFKFPQFREVSLQFRETWRSRAISGDSRKFRETWQVWYHPCPCN